MIYNKSRRNQDLPILTTFTCIWCVAMFIMVHATKANAWSHWGYYSEYEIYRYHKFWALISHAFIHVEPVHLLFNLSWAWTLGGALERSIGPVKWAAFVLSAAFVSSGIEMASGSSGIGFSGVVYAMFGFAWLTRGRYPELVRYANAQTARLFIGWGILCIFLTQAHIMNVANYAHGGGLVFGAAVGTAISRPKLRIPMGLAVALMVAVSIAPFYWSPFSEAWKVIQIEDVSKKAFAADDAKHWSEALRYYQKLLDMGADPSATWYNIARCRIYINDIAGYKEALAKLKEIDPAAASDLVKAFGEQK